MAAPAGGITTTTIVGQDEAVPFLSPAPVRNALPRAIQLVMAIVWSRPQSSTTTTASSTRTIADLGPDRLSLWTMLVVLPFMLIVSAAGIFYARLCDDIQCNHGGFRVLISLPGGVSFLAIGVLLFVYMAVMSAAGGHVGLFAPRTPVAAWEAFYWGSLYEGMGLIVILTSFGFMLLVLLNQAWPLLFAWACLLGLLIVSVVAFWLCLLRTYGERRGNSSCGETVIDGLAYLYCRLLYEYAVRFHAVSDADAGMQQLDVDVSSTSIV